MGSRPFWRMAATPIRAMLAPASMSNSCRGCQTCNQSVTVAAAVRRVMLMSTGRPVREARIFGMQLATTAQPGT